MATVNPAGAVATKGLKELIRAFDKFDKDLSDDLVNELAEAAQPVAKLSQQYSLSGGGGFPGLRGLQPSSQRHLADYRIGVSRRSNTVWVAPNWRSNKGTLQGQWLALQERWRMEGAVEDKTDEIKERLGDFLDTLAAHWGSHLT